MKRSTYWKQQIKERPVLCQQCFKQQATKVYHHDGNVMNDDEENLILLCDDCHAYIKGHKKRKTAKQLSLQRQNINRSIELLEWVSRRRYFLRHATLSKRVNEALRLLREVNK